MLKECQSDHFGHFGHDWRADWLAAVMLSFSGAPRPGRSKQTEETKTKRGF
jgi:hypothetical protein